MKLNLKNRYIKYLEQAKLLEKDRKFETAKILYKKCIEINPDDHFSRTRLNDLNSIGDYSRCICVDPGFCPRYNKDMSKSLINHDWCSSATIQERQLFAAHKTKLITHYSLEDSECIFANCHKKQKQFPSIKIDKVDFDQVKILCLGHSKAQFDTIADRPYLEKVNLNNIDAGKYSGNDWSESRAFISKDNLFKHNPKFMGFVTASWNRKYHNLIDNFHEWDNAKILLSSKPEDKIFLCADIYCCCLWLKKNNILSSIYKHNSQVITKSFLKLVGFKKNFHRYVPYSNQMISHKENIQEYIDFLIDNDIFGKVDWFVNSIGKENFTSNYLKHDYNNCRLNGYFMEMTSCFWFAEKNYTYLSNTTKAQEWYSEKQVNYRGREWK